MMLRHLSRDPSVRLTEDGRVLLRWLNVVAVRSQDWDRLLGNVPPHRVQVIAELARGCAEIWQRVAEQLGQADADETDGQALHDADRPPHRAALRSGLRRAVDVPVARPDERALHELGKAARPW